jgi:hypothetical protein
LFNNIDSKEYTELEISQIVPKAFKPNTESQNTYFKNEKEQEMEKISRENINII